MTKIRCYSNGLLGRVSVYFFDLMSDLAISCREDGNFDLDFDEGRGDLLTTDSLKNTVAISIGTYARERNLGNVANLKPNVGGWFGDALDEKGTLGGYLYEAFPGKLTQETARSVDSLVLEALNWMVEDGVAKSVKCESEIVGDILELKVNIERPEGDGEAFLFELNWSATDGI